jgi:hypothetical protein
MCVGGFPFAVVPLWQLAHVPGAMPTCVKRALENVTVLWHTLHA